MKKKNLLLFVIPMLLVLSFSLFAQDNSARISSGRAPYVQSQSVQYPMNLLNYNTRAFGYNAYGGTIAVGPFKMWLSMPFGMTSLFTDPLGATEFVQAGSLANGIWYGVRYEAAPPTKLVSIDTSTGVITFIANITGASSVTGLAWDATTNTMYASDYGASNKLGTINLTTAVFTPLAGVVGTGLLIDIACSNNGTIYGNMITSATTPAQIYTINKTTGVGTALPQNAGYIANYAQGMSWDHAVDSGYLAAYNYTTSAGELRKIDPVTGATTLIGTLGSEVDGFMIPGVAGPSITHTPLPNTQNVAGPYVVNAVILPAGVTTITSTKIYWSRNFPTITDSVTMTNSGNNWTGNIPGNGSDAIYRYYIKAIESDGLFAVHPNGAPASLNTFTASAADTIKPVLVHTPIGNTPKPQWPVTVNATATDNIGIDSVWVKWYKNTPSTLKQFKLLYVSGNSYSAPFNSLNSDVNINDSIFYRVFVQDAGSSHLKDSTALIQFKIIQLSNVCIGTGTTPSNYPYTTYWDDGRTDLLYLASEITGAGGYPAFINKIAFNVISVGGPAMNGFNIKMQTTTATSLTAFTNTGWTVCYNGVHTVTSPGWDTIGLTTPFSWNGTSNLLVEICYNNATYTAYSPVYASTTTGTMMAAYSTDLPTGDGCTAAWTATTFTYRPNICFSITPMSGIISNNGNVPAKYNLSQNYPNPFNPVTQIKYDLPKEGFVTLKVFDVLGREVSKLINEVKTPGSYIVDFDGTSLSSGVYFYKLEINGFSDVKRMVLIK